MFYSLNRLGSLVSAFVFFATVAMAQDDTAAAREIMNKHKETVVTVRMVISQQISMQGMGSQDRENRIEVTGTIVDPSGLTVVSLTETDPSTMIRRMARAQGREVNIESQIKEAHLIQPDGSEVPAKIVLRDPDMDMTFLRPESKTDSTFASVDLSDASTPQVLDQIVFLSRLGRVANRAYGAAIDRIQAVIERPRTLYVPVGVDSAGSLGSPAYTLDGKFVGVALLRAIQSEGGEGGSNTLVVIVPASDIQEAAAQAPSYEEAAKAEEAGAQPRDESATPENAPEESAPDNGAAPAPPTAPEDAAPAPASATRVPAV